MTDTTTAGTDQAPGGVPTARISPFDPSPELARLRETRPVSRMTFPDGHLGWLVTSHAGVRAVLADNRFSSRADLARAPIAGPRLDQRLPEIPPGLFNRMDEPEHTKYRRLLTGQFTVRRMNQLVPRIERITEEHLDAIENAGPPADLVETFARPIPSLVICELLGVPYTDREEFQRDSAVLFNLSSKPEDAMNAWMSLRRFLGALVRAKQVAPDDDLLSGLVAGGELTEEELITIGMVLLIAGHETTAKMLALGTFALLRHPDQLVLLRADPTLINGAVEELMRYLTIIHIGPVRTALEDVELDGHLVKAGDSVALSLPAADRDPAKFTDPDRLDVTRSAQGHVGFGHGIHQCLGQQLARIEMRVGYSALFRRFPTLCLAIPAEEVPMGTDMAIYGVHRLPVTWEVNQ